MTSIEKFEAHMGQMQLFLEYIFAVQQIVPKIATKVPKQKWKELTKDIESVVDFTRKIYNKPDLGSARPDPLPIDPACPDFLTSDHLRERLGRNHPISDLVNAPFTHPIGTQLAMICIDNAWNSYDTFTKELMGELKKKFPNHANIRRLRDEKDLNLALSTDEALSILKIAPPWEKISDYISKNSDKFHVRPGQAQTTFELAKKLRTIRAHRFGVPSEEVLKLIESKSFEDYNLRILDGELEVTLVLSRNVIEVIQLKTKAMYLIAQKMYNI